MKKFNYDKIEENGFIIKDLGVYIPPEDVNDFFNILEECIDSTIKERYNNEINS